MKRAALILVVTTVLVGCGASQRRVEITRRLQQADLANAFDMARALDLHVTITQPYAVSSLRTPIVVAVSPAPGATVRAGSTVTFNLAAGPIGSPAVLKANRHYRVPNFVGRRALVATRWADRHSMFWQIASLPPLEKSAADHLLDAYVVKAQSPKPGDLLGQGRLVGRGYHVTPLALTVVNR